MDRNIVERIMNRLCCQFVAEHSVGGACGCYRNEEVLLINPFSLKKRDNSVGKSKNFTEISQ
jgi:hypothetical protein|tara:strand:- start:453 stop:638 length:186 start_codon:yes stop_codon:yes gene_type:complete